MGMTGQCRFVGELCKMRADIDAEYCPRHAFLVAQFGLEKARDIELGIQCRSCLERFDEDKLKPCWNCRKLICAECRRVGCGNCEDEDEDDRAELAKLDPSKQSSIDAVNKAALNA